VAQDKNEKVMKSGNKRNNGIFLSASSAFSERLIKREE
jgi:hypothetical protein